MKRATLLTLLLLLLPACALATVPTIATSISYTGNGIQTSYAIPFAFDAPTDITLTVASVTKTYTTDYLVTKNVGTVGGTLTTTLPPANLAAVVIARVTPKLQGTHFTPNAPFPAGSSEAALDRLTMMVQEGVPGPAGPPGPAGSVLGTGTRCKPAVWTGTASTIGDGGSYCDVSQFAGWGGTGAQNKTAFQAAYDALPSTGGTLIVPTGTFNWTGTVSGSKPVTVICQGRSQTTLTATTAADPMFSFTTSLSIKFKGCSLTRSVVAIGGGDGIKVAGSGGTENQNSSFEDMQFDQQSIGLNCASCSSFALRFSFFTNNVAGGLLIDNVDTPDAGDSKIIGNHFIAGPLSTHVFQQAAGGWEAVGNKFSGGLNAFSINIRNGVTTSVGQFVANSIEDFASHGFVMTTTGTGAYSNFVISANECRAVSVSAPCFTIDGVSAAAAAMSAVSNNIIFIDQDNGRGVELIHSQDIFVSGNTIGCGSATGTVGIFVDATAVRPTIGQNFINGCGTTVENNGVLNPSYSGLVALVPTSTAAGGGGELRFLELRANGVNYVGFKAADSIASNLVWKLPSADASGAFTSDGSGVMAVTAGLSTTKTVRASGGAADCTITFVKGVVTASTC